MITVHHPRYADYFFGSEHPFNPIRYEMMVDLLSELGHPLDIDQPEPLSREVIEQIHDPTFVEVVCAASKGARPSSLPQYGLSTMDTPPFDGMDEAARLVCGGSARAAELILDDKDKLVLQLGGGLHHAHRARASGFCVYNDLAFAIQPFLDAGQRVAYVDIDVHHGDGVQSIFYDRGDVLTISVHESGRYLYPGTGFPYELGEGPGEGFKLNVPLAPYTQDDSYLAVFEQVVPHALSWFQPDVLIVQCGADAHTRDPLAHLQLTTRAYESVFRSLLDLADRHSEGRLLATLGGGYDFDATTRVWTLLYLLISDHSLPDELPTAWLERWEKRLSKNLTPTLLDPRETVTEPERKDVAETNREQARQLMNRAARSWRR